MSSGKALTYKGYCGSYEVDFDEGVFFGKIECINDLVTFEAGSVLELKDAFEEAVDDYLATCADLGKNPDKSFKGTFNVRIGEHLHKTAFVEAVRRGINLNELVKIAIDREVTPKLEPSITVHFNIENSKQASNTVGNFALTGKTNWKQAEAKKVH